MCLSAARRDSASHQDSRRGRLEAHERCDYRDADAVQALRRLVCLCTRCHEATHLGYAALRGRDEPAIGHVIAVNDWTRREADQHIDEAFARWNRRGRQDWTLDLSMLTGAGIRLNSPLSGAQRRAAADAALQARNGDPRRATADASPAVRSWPLIAPAGWYEDPEGRFDYRWHDGVQWTGHVAGAGGQVMTDPGITAEAGASWADVVETTIFYAVVVRPCAEAA